MSEVRQVRRQRLYEQVVEALVGYARSEGLSVGEKLPPERALAERLGVSRPSLKQALIALEVQGLIETRHGGGSYLRSAELSVEPLESLLDRRTRLPDILDAREALEVKLAALAAERRTGAKMREIELSLEQMEAEIEADGDIEKSDARFHRAVAAAAHSVVLERFMRQISDDIAESRRESLRQPGRPARSLDQHQRIAREIQCGDSAGAAEAMRRHLGTVRDTQLLNWQPEL